MSNLVGGDAEGRHEDDDAAERAEDHAVSSDGAAHPCADGRFWRIGGFRVPVAHELDADHEPTTTDLTDVRQRGDVRLELGREEIGQVADPIEDAVALEE